MNTPMKNFLPEKEHIAFRDDCIALLNKHSGHLDASVMLALASHLVGQIVAMQDQRKFNSELVMGLVAANIQKGNQEVLDQTANPAGRA